MKNILFLFIIFFVVQVCFAQTEEFSEKKIYYYPDFMAIWPGCESVGVEATRVNCSENKIIEYLIENINYPGSAMNDGVEGKVFIQFIVDKSGRITEPKIIKGVSPELDAEAIRVVSKMPDWIPGRHRNENVAIVYTLPIDFKLNKKDIK